MNVYRLLFKAHIAPIHLTENEFLFFTKLKERPTTRRRTTTDSRAWPQCPSFAQQLPSNGHRSQKSRAPAGWLRLIMLVCIFAP
jgi:hypothetical protein